MFLPKILLPLSHPPKLKKKKCFKCLSFGHIAANFLLKGTTLLNEVKQDHHKTKSKRENEREKEGQDITGLIPSPPKCFPSLSFSFPKHSKYFTFLFKKFRDGIPNPPKGSHLLKGFLTKYFIPQSSFQACLVARIQPYHLPKLKNNKFASPIHSPTNVRKLTLLFAGIINSWTNSFVPGEHDENKKYMKMTKNAIFEGSSQQAFKDAINRRNDHGPQHLKFFLLVFLI